MCQKIYIGIVCVYCIIVCIYIHIHTKKHRSHKIHLHMFGSLIANNSVQFLGYITCPDMPCYSPARQVKAQRRGSDVKHLAKVLSVGWECDAAVLTVENDELPG